MTIPDAVLAQHTAVLGKTGAGKTSTEKLIVEQVVAEGFRVCVLDSVKSDWWGITSSADGKRPGLPFKILGGPRGHVPLHSSAGQVIGRLVGAGKLPLSIIDMADFEAGGLQRFFIDFAQALMRHARGVVYLVIEEAHEFAPKERSGIGAENMAIHWAKKLATAGRSKGIRLVVATQRTQSLHNAVLGSCETIIAHRLSTPADQEPVLKWLKANADKEMVGQVMSSLSSLPTGTGWLCSGEARIFEKIGFPKFTTYDNTATPTGDGDEIKVATAPVDQDELRAIIGDAVKEAEANDPTRLKRTIAELQKQIASNQAAKINTPDPKAIEMAEDRGYRRGVEDGHVRGQLAGIAIGLRRARQAIDAIRIDDEAHGVPATVEGASGPVEVRLHSLASPAKLLKRPETIAPKPEATGFSGPEMRVLRSVAMWASLGHDIPTKIMVAGAAGYSPGSGGFANLLGRLRAAGAVDYPEPGRVRLLEDVDPMSSAEARDAMFNIMSGPQRRIFDALIPGELSKDELAAAAGYSATSGGFANLLGSLRSLSIIDYPSKGRAALEPWVYQIIGGA